MTTRIALLLVALSTLAFTVAGCGGDDEDQKPSTGSERARTAATEAAPRASEQSSREGEAGARQQAIETCKQRITLQPGASADLKRDLEAICVEGASGDENRRREAAERVCKRIVEETAPPGAAARAPLLKGCEQRPATP
jgi:hypothetical protein